MYTFSSVQSLDRLGRRRDTKDASAEILFRSFLHKAVVSSSGMGRDVHSLLLSIHHFLCRPRRRLPSNVPRRMDLERQSWRATCPSHANMYIFIKFIMPSQFVSACHHFECPSAPLNCGNTRGGREADRVLRGRSANSVGSKTIHCDLSRLQRHLCLPDTCPRPR